MTRTRRVIRLEAETNSQLDETEYHLTWNIPNFIWHKKRLSTSVFGDQDKTLEWKILLDLFVNMNGEKWVHVFVARVGSRGGVTHSLIVSILNSNGNELLKRGECWENNWVNYGEFYGKGFDLVKREALLDERSNLLCDGDLTLFCEFSVTTFEEKVTPPNEFRVCRIAENHLTRDLENLFETRIGCDVTLCTGGAEFSAHKAILMARSSVFAAMFENNMMDDRVLIPDLSTQVLREMLRFLYTGKNPEGKITTGLLMAADKYDLAPLKAICEDALSSNISAHTAAEMLRDADKYNAQQLKTATIHFVKTHGPDVITTEGWKNLVQHQPHLVAEVFKAMSLEIGFAVVS